MRTDHGAARRRRGRWILAMVATAAVVGAGLAAGAVPVTVTTVPVGGLEHERSGVRHRGHR